MRKILHTYKYFSVKLMTRCWESMRMFLCHPPPSPPLFIIITLCSPSHCYKYLAGCSLLGHVVYYNSIYLWVSSTHRKHRVTQFTSALPLLLSNLRLVCGEINWMGNIWGWSESVLVLWYLCWKCGPRLQCGPAMSWCWGSCAAPPVWPSSCQMCSSSVERIQRGVMIRW